MIGQKKDITKRLIIEIVLFVALLLSDLLSKDLVMNRLGLEMYEQYIIIDGIFAIYPCTNDGASFSIFAGQTWFLVGFTSLLMIGIIALMVINLIKKPKTSWLFRWSMLLIVSGGIGNLYDRIFCDGEVRDFIQYMFLDKIWQPLFGGNFGVGNIADIYLVLGVFMICAYIVFDYKEGDLGLYQPKNKKQCPELAENESVSEQKAEDISEDKEN